MIFTVGHREGYEAGRLACEAAGEPEAWQKVGRREHGWIDTNNVFHEAYPGGSVWKTEDAARIYLDRRGLTDFTVYGVDAEWDTDTAPSADGPWHDLLRDAHLIALEPTS